MGYSLEAEIPNHSVLSKARRRWGAEVFARLFRQSVAQCLEAGLIEGSKLHTDSSLVRADASAQLGRRSHARQAGGERGGGTDQARQQWGRWRRAGQSAAPRDDRSGLCARPAKQQAGKSHPSYKSHRALDDKLGVITAVTTTNGVRDDGAELSHLLAQHLGEHSAQTAGGGGRLQVWDERELHRPGEPRHPRAHG